MDSMVFMRITVVFIAVLLVIGWFILEKIRYQKQVIGKVFCEFVTKEGNGYKKMFPLESDGFVEIKPNNKKRKSRIYALEDLGTYLVDYPPGKWAFLQSKVKKALLDEDSLEPLSNRRGIVTLSPMRLANLINERFSALGVAFSQDEAEQKGMKIKTAVPPGAILYIILGVIGVGLIGLGYFVVTKWQLIGASLGVE